MLSNEAQALLKAFCNATKIWSEAHPLDAQRWREFMIVAYPIRKQIKKGEVSACLQNVGWQTCDADVAEEHYNRDVKIIEACREKDWLHRLLLVIAGR